MGMLLRRRDWIGEFFVYAFFVYTCILDRFPGGVLYIDLKRSRGFVQSVYESFDVFFLVQLVYHQFPWHSNLRRIDTSHCSWRSVDPIPRIRSICPIRQPLHTLLSSINFHSNNPLLPSSKLLPITNSNIIPPLQPNQLPNGLPLRKQRMM